MRGMVIAGTVLLLGLLGWASEAAAQVVAPTPATTRRAAAPRLQADIQAAFQRADLGERARLGVLVLDARTEETQVEVAGESLFRPASVMKLFTTAVALDLLGPEFTTETRVELAGTVREGTLFGDVVVVGGGDPTLGPRFQKDPTDTTLLLREWARALRKQGITLVDGNVVGVDTRYQNDPVALGWEPMELAEWYSAEVSALSFNDNTIDILWEAGGGSGDRARFRVEPKTDYATVVSSVRVGPENQTSALIRYFRFRDDNQIRARGTMPPNSEKRDFAAVHDPAAYTAHLLMEALREGGVRVKGTAVNASVLGEDGLTTETEVLLTRTSPPLSEILPIINGRSQNLYAEMLLREVALASRRPATFRGGAEAVEQWLRLKRLHRTGFTMVDGSGLSPINRTSPRQVGLLLSAMQRSVYGAVFRNSLATPGKASLRNRFLGADFADVQETLHAKTGYITGVHSLAGVVDFPGGGSYVFVVFVTDFGSDDVGDARDAVDEVMRQIVVSPELRSRG